MGSQPGIVLYHAEYKNVRDILSQAQKGDLLDALMTFGETGEVYTGDDPLVNMAFNIHASAIRRTEEKYINRCQRNAENIRKRWERQKAASDTIEYDRIPTDTTGYKRGETKTKTKTETKTKNKKIFIPPTVDEVSAYCAERGNNIDADRFVSYYESNGWKIGKQDMKDWKAAVRTWESNQRGWDNELRGNREESDRVEGQRELYGL